MLCTTIIVIITIINIALIFLRLQMFGALYSYTDLHILFSFFQTHWNVTSSSKFLSIGWGEKN